MTLFRNMFQIEGTPEEQRIARRAIRQVDFAWEFLHPRLEMRGVTVITVKFKQPLLGPAFFGQSLSSIATVLINPRITPYQQARTLVHELGHQADAYWMTKKRRDDAHALFHPSPPNGFEPWSGAIGGVKDPAYLSLASEGFACGFAKVFAPELGQPAARFTHVLKKRDYEAFRGIVLRPRLVAEPVEPPIADPPPTEPEPPDPMDPVRAQFDAIIAAAEKGLAELEAAP